MEFGLSEAAARMWDVLTKFIGAVGIIAGGLWTLKKYFDDRTNERMLARDRAKSAEVEARKPFSTKQLELYFQAVEAASSIAAGPWEQRESHIETFWTLYWGPLALVEDQRVAQAMIQYGNALKANSNQDELKIYVLELAHACRASIAESWKVDLPSVEGSRFMSRPTSATKRSAEKSQ